VVDSLQIVKPFPIVAKDLLPLLATDNDEIKRPSNFISQFAESKSELMKLEREARIIVNLDGGPLNPHEHEFSSRSHIGGVGAYGRICEEIVAEGYKGFSFQAQSATAPAAERSKHTGAESGCPLISQKPKAEPVNFSGWRHRDRLHLRPAV
jgi:hypothetical protein